MKILQCKSPVILLVISLITVLSLFNCGQQDNTKKTDATIDSAKKEVEIPVVTTDSQAPVTANPVNIDNSGNKQQEVKADTKKEIIPADNTKVKEPVKKPTVEQPVVTEKKPVPNTNVIPPIDKTVVPPKETPVVKVPDPVKTTPETQPKTVEVPKPVNVEKPQPVPAEWIVPAKYKSMTNPFAVDNESIERGKSLYGTHCKSCHGSKGDGNGPKAAQLDTKMGSFLTAKFLAQKPGEVYYKTTVGRKDMPKFEKKIPDDEDRWAVVHYIMNLKN